MRSEELAKAVHAMPGPVFATLDGGQFDDLPAELVKADIKAQSLFLGQSDFETQKYGPWFADTYSASSLDRLLEVIGNRPAAVFWSFPAGERALYSHLRKINAAKVPVPRDGAPAPLLGERRPRSDYEITQALFRHWDPRVLSEVLTVLDEDQFARLLGGAQWLVLFDEDGHVVEAAGAQVATRQQHKMLELTIDQVEAISHIRMSRSRKRIAHYLKEAAPEPCAAFNEKELLHFVERCERSAAVLGVRNERSLGLWAYLQITSKGDFSHDPRIQDLFRVRDYSTPDQRVVMLFDARLDAMKKAR